MFNIGIIGTGYIGLVIGLGLADLGHRITFADIDTRKIQMLQDGKTTIYEPGLDKLLKNNASTNRISFTTDVEFTIKNSKIILIAVNTPPDKFERADISAVKEVAKSIGQNINEEKIICIKSTVPIGTHKIVESIIKQNMSSENKNYNFEVVSIPEFLREGFALHDFFNSDRIIIGTRSEKAFKTMNEIFSRLKPKKIMWTDNESAETIKYVSNSFLALKISFINEIAKFCDEKGVDILSVIEGVGLDRRIGNQFLMPGPGFGGSCFPKDILALNKMAEDINVELKTIKTTMEINDLQKKHVVKKLKNLLSNDLNDKTIAVLGLAFKANTDDVRYSPAIDIIKCLKNENAKIQAYDPQAMNNMKNEIIDILYCDSAYSVVQNADAILLLTEWTEFANLDFLRIGNLMKNKIILDTRNFLNIEYLKNLNFKIDTIGRSSKVLKNNNYKRI